MTVPPERTIGGMPRLTAADFAQVETTFAEAAPLAADARQRLLDAECVDRPDLRAELDALLAAHDRMPPSEMSEPEPAYAAGTRLGAYRLIEKIGEGGMGEVYRAARVDGAFAQQVAIKLTRTAIGHGDVLRRFRMERQILASLRHANIVTLLDGGATGEGQAYLVMEYVAGAPITQHCREAALSLEERLRLLMTVCTAVQYAHQHAVVHRDLKPSNIAITPEGVPKVLDFGVAKLLAPQESDATVTTGVVPAPLTPNYASPEQLRGLPVTTASDVYALGVLLYEMLTETRPYETQGKPFDQVLEEVVHGNTPRPSAAVDGSRLPFPVKRLRGDLDAIVLKAMAKEPAERYASAGELASDIKRFLDRDQVLARPPSFTYVLRRLAGRNKALVTVGTASLIAIVAAAGMALWQQQLARKAQARAEQRFQDVRQLANALIFKIHDAVMPLAGSTPVRRTIVDEALVYLKRLEAESEGDAALQLELAGAYGRLGRILGAPQTANLGDRDGAIRELEHARSLVLPVLAGGPSRYDAVQSLQIIDSLLVGVYGAKGEKPQALDRAREAVEHTERLWLTDQADSKARSLLARATFDLAWISPALEARPIWHKVRMLFERELAERPDDPNSLRNIALVDKYLGANFEDAGDDNEARTYYERALAIDQKRLERSPDDRLVQFDTSISYANVATAAQRIGDFDTAVRLYSRSLELRRRLADSDPTDQLSRGRLGYILIRVAGIHQLRGEIEPAVRAAREAVSVLDAVLKTSQDRAARHSLAEAWLQTGRVEAMQSRREASCAAFRRAKALFGLVPVDEIRTRGLSDDADQAVAACERENTK